MLIAADVVERIVRFKTYTEVIFLGDFAAPGGGQGGACNVQFVDTASLYECVFGSLFASSMGSLLQDTEQKRNEIATLADRPTAASRAPPTVTIQTTRARRRLLARCGGASSQRCSGCCKGAPLSMQIAGERCSASVCGDQCWRCCYLQYLYVMYAHILQELLVNTDRSLARREDADHGGDHAAGAAHGLGVREAARALVVAGASGGSGDRLGVGGARGGGEVEDEPGVSADAGDGEAALGVHGKHAVDEVGEEEGDALLAGVARQGDALADLRLRIAAKGQAARRPGVQDHTHAPDVELRALVGHARDELGSREEQGAEALVEGALTLLEAGREAKVGKEQQATARAAKEEVLALDVAMNEAVLVEVSDGADELRKEIVDLALRERESAHHAGGKKSSIDERAHLGQRDAVTGTHEGERVATGREGHGEENGLARGLDIGERHHVGVAGDSGHDLRLGHRNLASALIERDLHGDDLGACGGHAAKDLRASEFRNLWV